MRDLYILFHGRFPSEKAAGLFAHLEAASFAAAGQRVTMLVPRRRGRGALGTQPYRVVYLPTLDLYAVPVLGYVAHRLSYILFAVAATLWLLGRASRHARIISNEAFPLLLASYFFKNTLYELHDFPEQSLWMYRALFKRACITLSTNEWKAAELQKSFGVPAAKLFVERNAVDVATFAAQDKQQARQALGLKPEAKVALYTGHLYAWKGVDTLAAACTLMPEVEVYTLGGTEHDLARFKKTYGHLANLHVMGQVAHGEVPQWQAAADVLVLPNTAKESISARYTSPMKLFEYMASGRPVVASDLPSIAEILTPTRGYLFEPDNAQDLARAVREALADPSVAERTDAALAWVGEHTWQQRTKRILAHLN